MAVVSSAAAGIRACGADVPPTIVQLRAPGLEGRHLEREATELVARSPVPVLLSSRCDIALATGAAGVNLPEHDISIRDARRILGERLIGRSVHTLDGALSAQRDGADFVILGPVWATPTHPDATPIGLAVLSRVCQDLRIPVLAIGGVTRHRVAECLEAGAAGYAAIRRFA